MKTLSPFFTRTAMLTVAMLLFASVASKGQVVCPVKFPAGADAKVFITRDSTAADLIVYATQDTSAAGGNNGVWYFSSYGNSTTKKIYFIAGPADADFSIYLTSIPGNAGWINTSKSYLMN